MATAKADEDLAAWLARATSERAARKQAAEALVATWEWASKPARHVDPVYFERHAFGRGKRLAKAPATPKIQNTCYGLDALGRVVVEREVATLDGTGAYEHFYAWRDDGVEWVRYDVDRRAQAVHRAAFEDGRVVALWTRGAPGGYALRFTYEGPRLAAVEETYRAADGRSSEKTFHVRWDVAGRLASIVEGEGEQARVRYEAPKKGLPLDVLLGAAVERLATGVPAVVRAMRITEPAYAVIVAFPGPGNDNFPPTVGVGLERERAALVAAAPKELASALWNPGDFEHYETETTALAPDAELFASVNRQVTQVSAWPKVSKAYARLARELRALDWSKVLPVTEDFVVLAVDYDETELAAALRAAVPAPTYAAWKKKRWAK